MLSPRYTFSVKSAAAFEPVTMKGGAAIVMSHPASVRAGSAPRARSSASL
jgi:hypothetical protein